MKVVFRCDASRQIGTGHVLRCLALARELRRRGTEIRFITRAHDGHLGSRLSADFMPTTLLPSPSGEFAGSDTYADWRGVPIEQDAHETIAALAASKPDWLVVDHYGLDVGWERTLRPHCGRLMVIDDLPDRQHDCDLLLNQNHGATHGAVPAGCRLLLGPRHALLRPEYAAARALKSHDVAGEVDQLVVFFGGVDAEDMTGRTLRVLLAEPFAALAVDVVIGPNYPHRAALEILADQRGRTRILSHRPHLADVLLRADVAIGAGGGATWERLCLGVPSILIGVSENQLPACRNLGQDCVAAYLGTLADFTEEKLREELQLLLGSSVKRRRFADAGRELVDGLGALRVAECLQPTAVDKWEVVGESQGRFLLCGTGLPLARLVLEQGPDVLHADSSVLEPDLPAGAEARLLVGALALSRSAVPVQTGMARTLPPLRASAGADGAGRRLAILSDASSWLSETIAVLVLGWIRDGHTVEWVHSPGELTGGDACFCLGCSQIVHSSVRARYLHTLVVHESALPHGKGWSPMTWQVLEGRTEIPVSLIEAVDRVDSGVIYGRETIRLRGDELVSELRAQQATATIRLCRSFVKDYPRSAERAQAQTGEESFYPRRQPADSRLDPVRSLAEQFNQLRVVDNERYPAFFEYHGRRYRLSITTA